MNAGQTIGHYRILRPEGGELFYVANPDAEGHGPMMAVSVVSAGGFQASRHVKLFDLPVGVDLAGFDVSPDGQRFLAVQTAGEAGGQTTITVAQNWAKEFEKAK